MQKLLLHHQLTGADKAMLFIAYLNKVQPLLQALGRKLMNPLVTHLLGKKGAARQVGKLYGHLLIGR